MTNTIHTARMHMDGTPNEDDLIETGKTKEEAQSKVVDVYLAIFEGVHLELDVALLALFVMLYLPLDPIQESPFQDLRRGKNLPVAPFRFVPGREIVEQFRQVATDVFVACQQAEVTVQT